MELHKELMDTLYSIDWFSNCGKAIPLAGVIPLPAGAKIKRSGPFDRYERLVLERQGGFTAALFASHREEYNRWWNVLAKQFKTRHLPPLHRAWEAGLLRLDLNKDYIKADIAFNILSIAVIDAYREQLPMPDLFKTMLAIYQSGHLVCGWQGDEKTGNFIAY